MKPKVRGYNAEVLVPLPQTRQEKLQNNSLAYGQALRPEALPDLHPTTFNPRKFLALPQGPFEESLEDPPMKNSKVAIMSKEVGGLQGIWTPTIQLVNPATPPNKTAGDARAMLQTPDIQLSRPVARILYDL